MTYRVRFTPEAAGRLENLHAYISTAGTPVVAANYVDAIVDHCEGLAVFPYRGQVRDDIRPGLRIVSYRKRVVIAFSIDEAAERVTIVDIFTGGQDYKAALSEPDE
ncbi:MAG: type II toxin-antitoxin system RelE/ParE family toxin [Phycicoccus sp.]